MASTAAILGCIAMLLGAAVLYQAAGGPELVGRARVPPWVLATIGVVFFCGGLAFVLAVLGLGRCSMLVATLMFLALAAAFHYSVFVADLSQWSGRDVGPFSSGEATRILVVTVDLIVVLGWLLFKSTFTNGEPGPFWTKLENSLPIKLFPTWRRLIGIAVVLVAPALAIILHFAGVLDRISTSVRPVDAIATNHQLPARPITQFVGHWESSVIDQRTDRIVRVSIREQGDDIRIRFWQACPPIECEEGEFKARVLGPSRDHVLALEVSGTKDDLTRTFRFTPDTARSEWLILSDHSMRSHDQRTQYQENYGLKRIVHTSPLEEQRQTP